MDLTLMKNGEKIGCLFPMDPVFEHGKHYFGSNYEEKQIKWLFFALLNFFRTATCGEPLCVSGSEHTVKTEYFEWPLKNSEAAYVETVGLATWTAVS